MQTEAAKLAKGEAESVNLRLQVASRGSRTTGECYRGSECEGFKLRRASRIAGRPSRIAGGAAKAANAADSDIELRLQLAAEALRRQPLLPDAQRLLLQTIFAAAKPIGEVPLSNQSAPRKPVPARLALSPAGDVAFVSRSPNLVAIRVATKHVIYSVPLEDSYLAPSADGKKLVVLSVRRPGRRVRVLDAATGQQLALVKEVQDPIAWSVSGGSGSDLAAFAVKDSVYLCQLSTNCSAVTRNVLKDPGARDIELSLDGRFLAVDSSQASAERTLALYATSPWQHRQTKTHPATGVKRSMSLNNGYVAFCSSSGLTLYDAYDFSLDTFINRPFSADAIQCSFSREGVVTRHRDGMLRVWNDAGAQIRMGRANDPEEFVAVAHAGAYLVALGDQLKLWEVRSYGRRLDVPLWPGFYRGGAYTIDDAGQDDAPRDDTGRYDVESGKRAELRVDSGDASREAISESLRAVVFSRRSGEEQELVYREIRESAGPLEKWSWPLPAAGPSVLRSPSISISWDDRFVTARLEDATPQEDATQQEDAVQDVRRRQNMTVRQEDVEIHDDDPGRRKWEGHRHGPRRSRGVRAKERRHQLYRERDRLSLRRIPGKELRRLSDEDPRLRVQRSGALLFSPDGNVLAVGEAAGGDSSARRRWGVTVWAWPSLRLQHQLQHSAAVTSLAFRKDSRRC